MYVLVIQVQQGIHCWDASQYNIVIATINANRELSVIMEYVAPCARRIENASMDNFVYKVCVNRLVIATLHALTSNIVLIIFARRKLDVKLTMTVDQLRTAFKTRMAVLTVRIHVTVERYVVETLNVTLEIIMQIAVVKQVLLVIRKWDAVR